MNDKQKGCLIALVANVIGLLSMITAVYSSAIFHFSWALTFGCMLLAMAMPLPFAFLIKHYVCGKEPIDKNKAIAIPHFYESFFKIKYMYVAGLVCFAVPFVTGLLYMSVLPFQDHARVIVYALVLILTSIVSALLGIGAWLFFKKKAKGSANGASVAQGASASVSPKAPIKAGRE